MLTMELFLEISSSLQSKIEEFIPFVIKKKELKCQSMSKLIALLPLLVNRDFKSDVEHKFHVN